MDQSHQDHLARILENRRKRKGPAKSTTSTPAPEASPAPGPPSQDVEAAQAAPAVRQEQERHQMPARHNVGNQRERRADAALHEDSVGMRHYSSEAPIRHSSAAGHSRGNASDINELMEQNRHLQESQVAQERKIDGLAHELRMGLQGISSTLRGSAPLVRAPQQVQSRGLVTVPQQEQRAAPNGPQYPIPSALVTGVADNSTSNPVPSMIPFRVPVASAHVDNQPRRPPVNSRPFSTSTLDIDSSVTILRSGDWWLKWNRRFSETSTFRIFSSSTKGSEVQPRYIWLDTEKYLLSWGKAPRSISILSGNIRVEEISGVSTSQSVEYDDDRARVFFILIIHTPFRKVYLATEKREKLDKWYDALTNVATFYRSKGRNLREDAPGTE